MRKQERLKKILNILSTNKYSIPGQQLAEKFGVTRQVIVKDIAILKAQGYDIQSSPKGYSMNKDNKLIKLIAVKHTPEQIEDELKTIVNCGGRVIDVSVEHPVYGELSGKIDVDTIEEVENFIAKLKTSKPLSIINNGVHLHRIEIENEEQFNCIKRELKKRKILLD
ncbi:MAG: transcription repressor NadR [Thermotogota bacterium]|nr:transcription repressor NadR [Thermotogota bacterium]